MIPININSEIGVLRSVVLHTPLRKELERMTPSNHEALLFDDILCWTLAVEEHLQFRRLFEDLGIRVYDVCALSEEEWMQLPERARNMFPNRQGVSEFASLLPTALTQGVESRQALIDEIVDAHKKTLEDSMKVSQASAYAEELRARLKEEYTPADFARLLLEGVIDRSLARTAEQDNPFLLPPTPNLIFSRDPAAVIGKKVRASMMAKAARQREGIILGYIFEQICGTDQVVHLSKNSVSDREYLKVEGGDVLVLHDRFVAIGCSERTTHDAIEALARNLFKSLREEPENQGIEIIYAVLMPQQRRTMHLDTIFTAASEDEFLVYSPLMLPSGIEQAKVIKVTRHNSSGLQLKEVDSLLGDIEKELQNFELLEKGLVSNYSNLDLRVRPIRCGGTNAIAQDREQWSDGANMLALAPGIVVGYDRNEKTFRELERAGYEIVRAGFDENDHFALRSDDNRDMVGDIKKTMAELAETDGKPIESHKRKKYAIKIPGSELSRARGGPRCMTMPLERAAVPWKRLGWICKPAVVA